MTNRNPGVKKRIDELERKLLMSNYALNKEIQTLKQKAEIGQKEVVTMLIFTKSISDILIDKKLFTKEEFVSNIGQYVKDQNLADMSTMGPYAVHQALGSLEAIMSLLSAKEILSEKEVFDKAKEIETQLEEEKRKVMDTQALINTVLQTKQKLAVAEEKDKENLETYLNGILSKLKEVNEEKYTQLISPAEKPNDTV